MVDANSGFTFKASANVGVAYFCDTTAAAVQAGSTKGKWVYGGTTNGGGVRVCDGVAVSTSTGYSAAPSDASDGCGGGGSGSGT